MDSSSVVAVVLVILLLVIGSCVARYHNVKMKREHEEQQRLLGRTRPTFQSIHPPSGRPRAPAGAPPKKVHSPDPATGLTPGTMEHVRFGSESGEAFVAEPVSQADLGRPVLGRAVGGSVVSPPQPPRPKASATAQGRR